VPKLYMAEAKIF